MLCGFFLQRIITGMVTPGSPAARRRDEGPTAWDVFSTISVLYNIYKMDYDD